MSVHWPGSSLGQWILAEEQPLLADLARRFHGDTLVWSGTAPKSADGVKRCMVRNRFYLAAGNTGIHADLAGLRGSLAALPFPDRAVDGFALHHSLELEADPRQALREVSRVIAPGGRVLICAFSSLSLWGLRGLYGRLHNDVFSGLRFINPMRLLDWLTLLGFKQEDRIAYLGYGLPMNLGWRLPMRLRVWLNKARPPAGGIFLISALKQAQGARWVGRSDALREPRSAPAAYSRTWKALGRNR